MTVLSALSAYQGPVVLLLVILGPTILRPAFLLRLIGRGPPRASPRAPRSPITLPAKLLLALHTLYRLHSLARPPYNIFTTHHLPIYASNDILRRHVLPHLASSSSTLSRFDAPSSQLELLLAKLAQLDNRILYSRYGHQPLSSCTWCHSSTDYLIAALPGVLQAYITMAWLVGMLGLRPIGGGDATVRKRAWRGSMCWILAVLAVGELGVRYLWEIRISEGDAIQVCAVHVAMTVCFTPPSPLLPLICPIYLLPFCDILATTEPLPCLFLLNLTLSVGQNAPRKI